MRLATIRTSGTETAALVCPSGVVPIAAINAAYRTSWPVDLFTLLAEGQFAEFDIWLARQGDIHTRLAERLLDPSEVDFAPPYRSPRKIWGIGLNYVDHAADLSEAAPATEPASFLKPATTIIGTGESIRLPAQSERVTAEAELGIVIGSTARDVPESAALSYVAGFTTIIDMTAEDILQRNPRYLTRAKSFDTFFSFGPEIITLDEFLATPAELPGLTVGTWHNDRLHRDNVVGNMTFTPEFLVSFHSAVMTLLPGDIISTGTPGAVVITDGDVVSCRIPGFRELANPVHGARATA
ncbi:2-keto-4-pentenoate hydratase/2-oxohepta-3-ene-1,7-dioic acid hydratase in catechol pathway [Tamaricihabitans halophyticus]|uniref:2-keto-4-pentenoate hydratase/2-oxohepta-3-ene-1,7-dioic acid hydratase in catechol pathway n=1 Tax=Tamaricihabitans halophyticus TaxID=1262583 RepID=A0A4R2QL08_9PSEU|nr:fumarylacetoacetate hydrolase family protein [Tamaricihabitans halophyticus]TCP50027.1 2-keto-4-pentenoate hydratase/2-oxohepta-3-ene-1,7-dioic acid hydratase in catechol pathway [Tamaricihabitans halophyticus]